MSKSPLSLEQEKRAKGLLDRAQMMKDEELDQVKTINKMALYTKVITVRDRQL